MTTLIPKYFNETDKPWLLRLIADCESFQDRTRKDFEHHMEQSAAAQGFPKFKLALALKALDLGPCSSFRQLLHFHQHLHEAFATERRPPAFGKDLMRQQSHSIKSSVLTPLNLSEAVVPSHLFCT